VAHKDSIEQIEKTEEDTAYIGLQIMQQERLREQLELTQYRLDLARVKGTCLLYRAMRAGWDHSFSTCPRRLEVFEERNKAR
jgi:hypothetical protein